MIPIKNIKPVKIGNSHYFLIPAQFIRNEVLNSESIYDIFIAEKKK